MHILTWIYSPCSNLLITWSQLVELIGRLDQLDMILNRWQFYKNLYSQLAHCDNIADPPALVMRTYPDIFVYVTTANHQVLHGQVVDWYWPSGNVLKITPLCTTTLAFWKKSDNVNVEIFRVGVIFTFFVLVLSSRNYLHTKITSFIYCYGKDL